MRGLGDGRRKLGSSARKLLEKMASGLAPSAVAAPLPRLIKERAERKAGYQHTSEDVTKWQPMVKVRQHR